MSNPSAVMPFVTTASRKHTFFSAEACCRQAGNAIVRCLATLKQRMLIALAPCATPVFLEGKINGDCHLLRSNFHHLRLEEELASGLIDMICMHRSVVAYERIARHCPKLWYHQP
jgi:hypothetical protein